MEEEEPDHPKYRDEWTERHPAVQSSVGGSIYGISPGQRFPSEGPRVTWKVVVFGIVVLVLLFLLVFILMS